MRDDLKMREDVERPADPANPNAGAIIPPYETVASDDRARLEQVAVRIARFINLHRPPDREAHNPLLIAMDLVTLHCMGRPLDTRAMLAADIVDLVAEYAIIFANIDRTCGKLPAFVHLRWQVSSN